MKRTLSPRSPLAQIPWPIILTSLMLGGCTPAFQERANTLSDDGMFLFQKGNYQAAHDCFQSAHALQPDNLVLLYNVGQCAEKMGNAAEAEKIYLDCLQREPGHAPTRQALCGLMVSQGRKEDARKFVDDWLAHEPKSAPARAADGWLIFQGGNLPEAQAKLQEALQLDGKDVMALSTLGQVFESMGRPDRALALYQRALEENPNQPDVEERVNKLKTQGVGKPRID